MSITTAADDTFYDTFPDFRKNGMIFHENRLPPDDSHEIASLIYHLKKQQNLKLSSAAKGRWRFMVSVIITILPRNV